MTDPHHLARELVDSPAVTNAARRLGGRLASLHAFTATPAARLYPLEHQRLARRAAMALVKLLQTAEAARVREEATT